MDDLEDSRRPIAFLRGLVTLKRNSQTPLAALEQTEWKASKRGDPKPVDGRV